ncbi:MAG: phage tail sheath family protein [Thermoanaerobaculia bacterium]
MASTVQTITGVPTSITAFIGRAQRGKVDDPIPILSFGDYERSFGGLWQESTMSYAVQQYFLNGGMDALIVRVQLNGATAAITLPAGAGQLVLEAASEGAWGNELHAAVDHDTTDPTLFNLAILETEPGTTTVRLSETFSGVSVDRTSSRSVVSVLEESSQLVRVRGNVPHDRPDAAPLPGIASGGTGSDGDAVRDATILGSEGSQTGLYALEKVDLFNLLCIPPLDRANDIDFDTRDKATAYCERRGAMFLVDAPAAWTRVDDVAQNLDALMTRDSSAAFFFPRISVADPLDDDRIEAFAPCGAVAGVFARTDSNAGVWTAPAGIEATLRGVSGLSVNTTDDENGRLNVLAVNCLRTFPVYGTVVWGSRTLEGTDALASDWKYIPVRRLTLFIQESLYRGTRWAVFEPNNETLWAQIRLTAGAFMQGLWSQGAFQGASTKDAYFVQCDSTTTTQSDIASGVVNIVVGFAPLKPAEFVLITIQQNAQGGATSA